MTMTMNHDDDVAFSLSFSFPPSLFVPSLPAVASSVVLVAVVESGVERDQHKEANQNTEHNNRNKLETPSLSEQSQSDLQTFSREPYSSQLVLFQLPSRHRIRR